MKKVSIIVPIYNVQDYLEECIESLVNQTYKKLEIILVNDGSIDNSGKICDLYGRKDTRIIVIHQNNQGAAAAKNAGLRIMSGDYFMIVDGDDYLKVDAVASMVNLADETGSDIVESGFYRLFINEIEEYNKVIGDNKILSGLEYMRKYLDDFSCSMTTNKLFKREIGLNIFFRKERRCIDDEFYTYKLILNAKKITETNESYYYYRQRKSSVMNSRKNYIQVTEDALEVLIERYELVTGKYPELKNIYLKKMVESLNYFAQDFEFNKILSKKLKKVCLYCFVHAIEARLPLTYLYVLFRLILKNDLVYNVRREDRDYSQYFS